MPSVLVDSCEYNGSLTKNPWRTDEDALQIVNSTPDEDSQENARPAAEEIIERLRLEMKDARREMKAIRQQLAVSEELNQELLSQLGLGLIQTPPATPEGQPTECDSFPPTSEEGTQTPPPTPKSSLSPSNLRTLAMFLFRATKHVFRNPRRLQSFFTTLITHRSKILWLAYMNVSSLPALVLAGFTSAFQSIGLKRLISLGTLLSLLGALRSRNALAHGSGGSAGVVGFAHDALKSVVAGQRFFSIIAETLMQYYLIVAHVAPVAREGSLALSVWHRVMFLRELARALATNIVTLAGYRLV
ncbi:uncharacterized protein VTP21DRAFT_958 [Calcarisporiella thermophila]|uniref:uncharacterized protein n=1 Tax=Calcarisporiella thermophila TaxID=911321 RepID=UPI00374490CA